MITRRNTRHTFKVEPGEAFGEYSFTGGLLENDEAIHLGVNTELAHACARRRQVPRSDTTKMVISTVLDEGEKFTDKSQVFFSLEVSPPVTHKEAIGIMAVHAEKALLSSDELRS